MTCRVLIVAGLLVASAAVAAPSFDGTYTGTLTCPAFPGQEPVRAPMSMTVAGRTATYEREIVPPAGPGGAGTYERGTGTVAPDGKLVLTGGCEGGFSCATDYRGDLSAKPIRLKGTQRWWYRGGDRQRECEAELTRAAR